MKYFTSQLIIQMIRADLPDNKNTGMLHGICSSISIFNTSKKKHEFMLLIYTSKGSITD